MTIVRVVVSIVVTASISADSPAGAPAKSAWGQRIEKLNAEFLKRVDALPAEQALTAVAIRDGYRTAYEKDNADAFVPDALALLNADYRAGLDAFDAGDFAAAAERFDRLRAEDDAFLAANAAYFRARSRIELAQFEETEEALRALLADKGVEAHTPYAPHLWLLRAFCEARTLHAEAALQSIEALRSRYPDAPEAILVGARQLARELERREPGTLDEVAGVMDYVGDRLKADDAGQRVRDRQEEIIRLLDKLIEEQEKQEQSQCSGGGQSAKPGKEKQGGKRPAARPQKPAENPNDQVGPGDSTDLHAAPKASPGEMWGQLPPAEREKILQGIRERFPSRYRQLVEQFYRSLAEEK